MSRTRLRDTSPPPSDGKTEKSGVVATPGRIGVAVSARFVAVGRGIGGVLVLALALEVMSRFVFDPRFLPPFSDVLLRAVTIWGDPSFRDAVGTTLVTYLLGMLISAAIGIPLGITFGLFRPAYRAAQPIIELLRPLPPIILVPLLVLVLKSGLPMKVVVVTFAAVWPIVFNTLYGVRDVDPHAKEMARIFNVGRFGVIRRIVLPAAAPMIMTGIRIASSIALIVVVTVELVAGGTQGLGAYISLQSQLFIDPIESRTNVFAGTITAGVLGLFFNLALGWVERRFFGWNLTTRGLA